MATIPNGILGGIKGRVGTITGYNRYGVDVIRSAKSTGTVHATPKRTEQRNKIAVCNSFLNPFKGTGFFGKTFPAHGHTGSGHNRAASAVMNLAIITTNNGPAISYAKVLISKGALPGVENATAAVGSARNIQFTWTNNSCTGTAKETDQAVLVAYFPGENKVVYSLSGGTRASGSGNLPVGGVAGLAVETWIGFLSNDEKDAADSVYTGTVQL